MIGKNLAHFRITSKLGEGGMGEVWRGEDERLGRAVAIKLLPEALVAAPDRLARFEREARLLASLNHPNIGAIFDVGVEDSRHFLVLELVEGETLEDRLKRGAMPSEEATSVALQIAEALEVAHEQGIVHRDLKPGNVMVSPEGRVKVLDFGLAKDWSSSERSSAPSLTASPTMTAAQTAAGVLLGTAAYMSPEQARGQSADKRADIWAFGCVLWEMLSGHRLFEQATVSDTLAAVLRDEVRVESLPGEIPDGLRFLLGRCLERDPMARLRDIGEVRIALQGGSQIISRSTLLSAPSIDLEQPRSAPARLPWILVALLALSAVYLALRKQEIPDSPTIISSLTPPDGHSFEPELGLAVAPDGLTIVFAARDDKGVVRLWIRSLGSADATPVVGTEGASYPFWAPDGRNLAFFAGEELRRVPLAGGSARPLAKVVDARGGTWSDQGQIVFAPDFRSGLHIVSADGGEARVLTEPLYEKGEKSHRWPVFLEGGGKLLFLAQTAEGTSSEDSSTIEVLDLATGVRRAIMKENSSVALLEDAIVYWSAGDLYASRFDVDRAELLGEPRLVAQNVGYTVNEMAISAASESVLIVAQGSGLERRSILEWWSRDGEILGTAAPVDIYHDPKLSHDGEAVAFYRADTIWVRELARGTASRLTFEEGDHSRPAFSADDRSIVYTATRGGPGEIFRRLASGLGEEERLLSSDVRVYANDWSPDGKTLLLDLVDPKLQWDVRIAHLEDGRIEPLISTPFNEQQSKFSPDGEWVAYSSNESGRMEVYVVPVSGLSGRWQISTEGGTFPRWNPKGGELAWMGPSREVLVAEVIEENGSLKIGESRALFQLPSVYPEEHPFDFSPDGERLLVNHTEDESKAEYLTLVQNWNGSANRG